MRENVHAATNLQVFDVDCCRKDTLQFTAEKVGDEKPAQVSIAK